MYINKNDSFLYTCKENYFLGIYPLSADSKLFKGYQTLVQIAKAFFEQNQYDLFLNYLTEEKYLCNVWAAHMILEFGSPDAAVKEICQNILKKVELSEQSV